jgi:Zn-finger nucleic acid-binding protein
MLAQNRLTHPSGLPAPANSVAAAPPSWRASMVGDMDEMTCPKCQSAMQMRKVGEVSVAQCSSCNGIFLERADLWNLTEAENDWHVDSGPKTQPMPRITADMTAPPPRSPKARSYIETLFS